jgi:hypothetical protein
MAFIEQNNNVISFAEYQDVIDKDQRLFDNNEGLSESAIETALIRTTERILTKMRSSNWWIEYYIRRNNLTTYRTKADIPALDINRIIARQNDFTDLCVYMALGDIIIPSVADFGTNDNAERNKMSYYVNKAENLFGELISDGDWYDFDDDGVIESQEKSPGYYNLRRVR